MTELDVVLKALVWAVIAAAWGSAAVMVGRFLSTNTRREMPIHPELEAWLRESGYHSVDEWMHDSDFVIRDGEWCHEDGYRVDPEACIEIAYLQAREEEM